MPGIDYSKRYRDYARFTPAISEMYTRFVVNENPKRPCPVPQEDLDFLKSTSNLYHIPYSLYSAGQAAKSDGAAHKRCMVSDRDRTNTIILGDSGGFQIQTGAIQFKGDETRRRMMKWMEANCDWSMILDFPTGGINIGNVDKHYKRLISTDPAVVDSGHAAELAALMAENDHGAGFNTCLLQTMINNDWFMANRTKGKTKFLNVVQGRNVSESKFWFDKVKHYDFEGWSLAGPHKENFEMTMTRLIDMRDQGLLTEKDWMHFLGVGKLQHGCIYTTIQRCIRESVNPRFTISYDVSSPFTTAAYGNLFLGYTLDKNAWTIQSAKLDGTEYLPECEYTDKDGNLIKVAAGARHTEKFLDIVRGLWDEKMGDADYRNVFVETEIGKKLLMGDVCVNADPKFTSTWDVVSYAMMMNHNVQVHMESVFESQDLYDRDDVNRVPQELLHMKGVIKEIFQSETPYDVIRREAKVLNFLAGDVAERGLIDHREFEVGLISDHLEVSNRLKEFLTVTASELSPVSDLFAGKIAIKPEEKARERPRTLPEFKSGLFE